MNSNAKAPQRRRPKRVAKKLRQRGGYLHHDGAWLSWAAAAQQIGPSCRSVAQAMAGLARCMQSGATVAWMGRPR